MAQPTTRQQFKDYCLRKLGHPVIQINVDDDQVMTVSMMHWHFGQTITMMALKRFL